MTLTFNTTPQQDAGITFATELFNKKGEQQFNTTQANIANDFKSKFVPLTVEQYLNNRLNEMFNAFYIELLNTKIQLNKNYIETLLNAPQEIHAQIAKLLTPIVKEQPVKTEDVTNNLIIKKKK